MSANRRLDHLFPAVKVFFSHGKAAGEAEPGATRFLSKIESKKLAPVPNPQPQPPAGADGGGDDEEPRQEMEIGGVLAALREVCDDEALPAQFPKKKQAKKKKKKQAVEEPDQRPIKEHVDSDSDDSEPEREEERQKQAVDEAKDVTERKLKSSRVLLYGEMLPLLKEYRGSLSLVFCVSLCVIVC
jgi:hypothetical protein